MSDVPELDRLLEEAETVKSNREWDRQDRFIRRTLGWLIISFLAIIPLYELFGRYGFLLAAIVGIASVLPILTWSFCILLKGCFTDPPPRDLTRRYCRK